MLEFTSKLPCNIAGHGMSGDEFQAGVRDSRRLIKGVPVFPASSPAAASGSRQKLVIAAWHAQRVPEPTQPAAGQRWPLVNPDFEPWLNVAWHTYSHMVSCLERG